MDFSRIQNHGWHITPSIYLDLDQSTNGYRYLSFSFLKWTFEISWDEDTYDPYERHKNEERAVHECYVRLYAAANPPADFNQLMADAETNERGQKIIDYMAYEIEQDVMDRIIEEVSEEFELDDYIRRGFRNSIYLGCSPTFPKQKTEE